MKIIALVKEAGSKSRAKLVVAGVALNALAAMAQTTTGNCTGVTTLAGMGTCVEEKVNGLETAVIGVAIAGLVVATVIGAYKMFKGLAKG